MCSPTLTCMHGTSQREMFELIYAWQFVPENLSLPTCRSASNSNGQSKLNSAYLKVMDVVTQSRTTVPR